MNDVLEIGPKSYGKLKKMIDHFMESDYMDAWFPCGSKSLMEDLEKKLKAFNLPLEITPLYEPKKKKVGVKILKIMQ